MPTQHELDTCPHLHLTSAVEWDPQTMHLASTQSVEAEAITHTGLDDPEPGLAQISCVYNFSAMVESLHELYDINSKHSISATITDVSGQRTFISKEWHSAVTPEQLTEWRSIGLVQSKQTLQVTTQHGVQSAILPLSRWY